MTSNIKKLPKSMVEITIEVPTEEQQKFLAAAAEKISASAKIEGFRPGKAPFDIVKQKFGEMAILQAALEDIIIDSYYHAIKDNNLTSIGQPQIDVKKAAPGNPIEFTATVPVLPEVEIGDLSKIKIKKDIIEITEDKINKTLEEIRSLRATESKVDRPAKTDDIVKIDFEVFRDNVPIENGKSQNYPLKLGENRFIPGFEDNLIGASAGETKEFEISFPDEYHEKSLAGKPATFKVKVNEVAELVKPELTDEFAKDITAGKQTKLEELKQSIKDNLLAEEQAKQDRKLETEMLEAIVKASEFGELPEIIVHEEIHRMMHELEADVAKQGGDMAQYLNAIKKTPDELEKELEPAAEMRAKTSILAREIFQEQKMTVADEEVQAEIEEIAKRYPENADVRKQLETESYREYLKNSLGNRKVMDYLRSIIIK